MMRGLSVEAWGILLLLSLDQNHRVHPRSKHNI
jgi:hypothetical protein